MATGSAGTVARDYHTSQTHYLKKTLAFNTASNGASVTMGVVPANSSIVRVYATVTTAFNAGTTNRIDIGNTTTAAAFGTFAVTSAGVKTDTGTLATAAMTLVKPSADQTITTTYTQSATAASAGSADVIVEYINL